MKENEECTCTALKLVEQKQQGLEERVSVLEKEFTSFRDNVIKIQIILENTVASIESWTRKQENMERRNDPEKNNSTNGNMKSWKMALDIIKTIAVLGGFLYVVFQVRPQ